MAKIKAPYLGDQIDSLGDFIAAQRRSAELSLRQLALQTGVSNPYLSQIERGLRRPSAEVLQQLSKALRVSAETLYVRAGILDPQEHAATTVEMAVLADQAISERQKRVLIDVYTSFVKENEIGPGAENGAGSGAEDAVGGVAAAPTRPAKKAASTRAPSTKAPSTKAPSTKAPSTKAGAAKAAGTKAGAAKPAVKRTSAKNANAAAKPAAKGASSRTSGSQPSSD